MLLTRKNYNEQLWYIDNKAYDLTEFVARHPGGRWAIELGQGRDCTALFQSYHLDLHKPNQVLAKYARPDQDLQQPLTPGAQPVSFQPDGFYARVRQAAQGYFKEQGVSTKAPLSHLLYYAAMLALEIFCLLQMAFKPELGWAVAFGLLRAFNAGFSHAAQHFSVFAWPVANRAFAFFVNILSGVACLPAWDVQHNISHHVYTNDFPLDNDASFPLKSVFAGQPRLWYHRYQHLYSWLFYLELLPVRFLGHVRAIYHQRYSIWKIVFTDPLTHGLAYLEVALMLFVFLLPVLCQTAVTGLLQVAVASAISSTIDILIFAVNHEVDLVAGTNSHPEHSGHFSSQPKDWGVYQVEQSHSFAVGSTLNNLLFSGLNHQIEHHLFPAVHPAHLPALARLVKQEAQLHNIPYSCSSSFWQALLAHCRLLRDPLRNGSKITASSSSSLSSSSSSSTSTSSSFPIQQQQQQPEQQQSTNSSSITASSTPSPTPSSTPSLIAAESSHESSPVIPSAAVSTTLQTRRTVGITQPLKLASVHTTSPVNVSSARQRYAIRRPQESASSSS